MITELYQNKKTLNLSKSAIKVLELLESEDNIGVREITVKLNVSTRTVHYALKNLLSKRVIHKIPNLQDLRQSKYIVNKSNLDKLYDHNKSLIYSQIAGSLR
jgi:DNA-binding MarR family transcriptional regulator